MIGVAVNTDDSIGTPGAPIVLQGDVLSAFAFCVNGRGSVKQDDSIYNRQKTITWARGYLERVTLESVNAKNWRWRRIAFQTHSDDIRIAFGDSQGGVTTGRLARNESGYGYVRPMYNFSGNAAAYNALFRQLFQGTQGVDWTDIFNAPCNPRRVRVIMDKMRHITGGNDFGHWKGVRDWIPINNSIVYNEKEEGNSKDHGPEFDSNYSWFTAPHAGKGDVFVVDLFACAGGEETDAMNFLPHGTYYWHE